MSPEANHKWRPGPSFVDMRVAPKEIEVDLEWSLLVSRNPVTPIEPQVFVMAVPGGMLFRVVVPGNPMVFVPNLARADLVDGD